MFVQTCPQTQVAVCKTMSFSDAFRAVATEKIYPCYTWPTSVTKFISVKWSDALREHRPLLDCCNEVQGLTSLGLIAPGNKKLPGGNKISSPRLLESQLRSDQISLLSCFGFQLDLGP